MAKIVIWSMEEKSFGNTSVAVAISTLMSMETKLYNLISHLNWQDMSMESSYYDLRDIKSLILSGNVNIGMSALSRLIDSKKLTPDSVRNYAKPLLKDRLDVLFGILGKDKEIYDNVINVSEIIVDSASKTYDNVIIDCVKGVNETSKKIIKDADYVLVVLNQSHTSMDSFFDNLNKLDILKDKKYDIVIGKYDRDSLYNFNNIRRTYNYQEPIFIVPQNTNFMDACNDGKLIDFILKNRNVDINSSNGYFLSEVRKVYQNIIKRLDIKV